MVLHPSCLFCPPSLKLIAWINCNGNPKVLPKTTKKELQKRKTCKKILVKSPSYFIFATSAYFPILGVFLVFFVKFFVQYLWSINPAGMLLWKKLQILIIHLTVKPTVFFFFNGSVAVRIIQVTGKYVLVALA